MEQPLHLVPSGSGCIRYDGFANLDRDERRVLGREEAVDARAGSEIDGTGDKGHIVFVRHRESPFGEGTEGFVAVPPCRLGEDVKPPSALVEGVKSGVELLERLVVILRDGYAAYHMQEITDTGGEIGGEHGNTGCVACVRGDEDGWTVEEIDVIGEGDGTVPELLPVLAQILSAVHAHSHPQVQIDAERDVEDEDVGPEDAPAVVERIIEIGVILVNRFLMRLFQGFETCVRVILRVGSANLRNIGSGSDLKGVVTDIGHKKSSDFAAKVGHWSMSCNLFLIF